MLYNLMKKYILAIYNQGKNIIFIVGFTKKLEEFLLEKIHLDSGLNFLFLKKEKVIYLLLRLWSSISSKVINFEYWITEKSIPFAHKNPDT